MSIYQGLYDLVHQYVYGGLQLTTDMELVATLISTMGCVFLVALPFAIVWKIIKMIVG